ncbi:hypothetical protein [Bdellovibrio sp. HCB209]|uniref:hypothetical protein n=1 Tax=Bdellovibrio sp. HCB209 TaxID=3394354 RepID=UPI0039B47FA2
MDFEFQILNGRFNEAALTNRYEQAYETFKQTWTAELSTLKGQDVRVPSNDFTRQDYIIALYKGDTCVALDCMREVSISSYVQTEDSWFQPWDKKHFATMQKQGHDRAIVNSYFTVHNDFRRTVQGESVNAAYLAGALSVLYQVELDCSIMLGMMRNNRSMNALGASLGGAPIDTIVHNDLPTDLFVYEKGAVIKASQKFPDYVFEVFNNNQAIKKGRRHERVA